MSSNDKFAIRTGGLYAPLPIPAFQVLARAGEYQAQKVLLALVLHMGKNDNCVYPSYSTIAKNVGISRNSISKGLTVLFDHGFIKIARFSQGKQWRSKYYLQEACWNSGKMNSTSLKFRTKEAICRDCGVIMDRGGYGIGLKGAVHWGCGGSVVSFGRKRLG
jgi:hypothetical protein